MTKFIAMTVINLVTPKAEAKRELLFNKPTSKASSLNNSLLLAPALGVTKFIIVEDMILVAFYFAT